MTDMSLCAVCGLYCRACTVFIATKEDPERLAIIAGKFGVSPEEMACHGCRSDHRGHVCRDCEFITCAKEKGVSFCNACDEYPCKALREFNRQMPHRIEIFDDNERIRAVGWEKWAEEMAVNYACETCGTINSAYDPACRKCGKEPANPYVAKHEDDIHAYLKKVNR